MNDIEMQLNKVSGEGAFHLTENGKRLAELVFRMEGELLTVLHTEVGEKLSGQGIGKRLLNSMVDFARTNNLKVIPLCAYVSQQFRKDPDKYADVYQAG